jgi:quercetin dioxygenase-like cupin family protein
MMKSARSMLWPGVLIAGALFAQDAQVTPLMSKDLPEFPGKEAQMISVVYPPGATDPIHRHNAHGFVYVLEGTVVMQL